MRFGKITAALLTVLLLAAAVFVAALEPTPEEPPEAALPLSADILIQGQTERLQCWENEAGEWFFFLPGCAQLSRTTLRTEDASLCVDGQPVSGGLDCGSFELNTPYALRREEGEATLTFLQSGDVPTLCIDVQSGNMDYIHETKGNTESGWVRLYTEGGTLDHSGLLEISGRGNSSWAEPKKPYSLTLQTDADLLGMGAAQEWILLANALDDSHLRNKLVYDFAGAIGMAYSPESQWVDLYLNGNYAGLYLLCERNEVHPERVDLPQADSFLLSKEPGYRLEVQSLPRVPTPSGNTLRIHYSGVNTASLTRLWASVDNAIFADDGIDPETGQSWLELIDLDSWVMEYLMGEVFGNLDAGSVSQFYYRDGSDESGKIYAGPVWDYDLSMGHPDSWQAQSPQAFFGNKPHNWSLSDVTWFSALYQKEEFYSLLTQCYETLFRPLVTELLGAPLDSYAARVSRAAAMDQVRWSTEDAAEATEHIRTYMTERLEFLDSLWLRNETYHTVLVFYGDGPTSACFCVRPGECVPKLPKYKKGGAYLGWYDVETDEPFDPDQPVYADAKIRLKARNPSEPDTMSPFQAVPIAAMLILLTAVIAADRTRTKRTDTPHHERKKRNEIPS